MDYSNLSAKMRWGLLLVLGVSLVCASMAVGLASMTYDREGYDGEGYDGKGRSTKKPSQHEDHPIHFWDLLMQDPYGQPSKSILELP